MKFQDIIDYNGICAAIKENPEALPIVDHLPEAEAKDAINSFKYKRMVRAMNIQPDGTIWEPNYNDDTEAKIEPYFGIKADDAYPGGFAFSDSYYDYWYTFTGSGARRVFQSKERFHHALKHFHELFLNEFLIIK